MESTTINTAFSVGMHRRVELPSRVDDVDAEDTEDESERALVLKAPTTAPPWSPRVESDDAATALFLVTRDAIFFHQEPSRDDSLMIC